MPVLAAVGRAEERGVLDAGVKRVGMVERRLEMPHALEFPRVRRAIVPLMRRERLAGLRRGIVDELIALAHRETLGRLGQLASRRARLMPALAAVVRALD